MLKRVLDRVMQIHRTIEYNSKMIGEQKDEQIQQSKKMTILASYKEPEYMMKRGTMIFAHKEMNTGRINKLCLDLRSATEKKPVNFLL